MQQEEEKGADYCRFSCLFGMSSKLLRPPKCINWSVSLKTLKSITFLKIHLDYKLVSSKRSQMLSPFPLSPEQGRTKKNASQGIPATKAKADRVSKASK